MCVGREGLLDELRVCAEDWGEVTPEEVWVERDNVVERGREVGGVDFVRMEVERVSIGHEKERAGRGGVPWVAGIVWTSRLSSEGAVTARTALFSIARIVVARSGAQRGVMVRSKE